MAEPTFADACVCKTIKVQVHHKHLWQAYSGKSTSLCLLILRHVAIVNRSTEFGIRFLRNRKSKVHSFQTFIIAEMTIKVTQGHRNGVIQPAIYLLVSRL